MSDPSKHRRPNHLLVTRQIQLEARRRGLPRSAVEDAPLNSLAGRSCPNARLSNCEVDTRRVANPKQDLAEDPLNIVNSNWPTRQHREVKVFGESIRLDVALLQTRPALKHPMGVEQRMATDSPQHPAEDIVLLHDILTKTPLFDPFNDVSATNHQEVITSALIRSFQCRLIVPRTVLVGSNAVMPALIRERLAALRSSAEM